MPEVRFGGGPRPDARAGAGAGDARLPARRLRRAGEHHHHRERARHPQRQHAHRGAGRPAGAGAALPDPGPHRAVRPGGARLPLPSRRGGAHRGGGGPALHPGRLHRAGLRLQDRHARPGDPRGRRAAGRGAVRPDRGGGLRDVPVDAARRPPRQLQGEEAPAGEGAAGGHRHRRARAGRLHRLRGGPGGPAPPHRLGRQPWRSWPTCGRSSSTASASCPSRWTTSSSWERCGCRCRSWAPIPCRCGRTGWP